MSAGYVPVQWNRHKRIYDLCIAAGVLVYLTVFLVVGKLAYREVEAISDEILLIRALGSAAFLMLHVVLAIGPAARLDRRFHPLLYNRRHLGVTTFAVALAHALLSSGYYHGFGVVHPLRSLVGANTSFLSLRAFPFQSLGLAALLIMFLMAATSHDFWNRLLGPTAWKSLHMLVYPAYGLLVGHVALGAMQTQRGPWLTLMVISGTLVLCGLHLAAGWREVRRDLAANRTRAAEWVDAGAVDAYADGSGRAVALPHGERIAVFRHSGRFWALTNVCAHQGGPLGEGRIIDGCVTCPWHGWTYRPTDGCAPPPFTERVATHRVRVDGERVFAACAPNPLATTIEPPVDRGPAGKESHR
jgi:sulfoxide reductase heme-binding subunit YedZ